jgi:branched-chain amino acid transport system substrate-binding protein
MKKLIKKFLVDVIAICLFSLFCFGSAPGAEPYKIGMILSLTGSTAPLGQSEKNGAEIAADKINKKGGINGRPIELVIYDDGTDPSKAIMSAKRLIEIDKVSAIVGPSDTSSVQSILPYTEKMEFPVVYLSGSSEFVKPVRKSVFKIPVVHEHGVIRLIESYLIPKGIKKVALLYINYGYGKDGRKDVLAHAPRYGIDVILDESFERNVPDCTPQLTKVKNSAAQALICWGTHPEPATIAKNAKQIGLTIPLLIAAGALNERFLKLAKDAAEGAVLYSPKIAVADQLPGNDPDKKFLLEFVDEYQKRYKIEQNIFSGYGYDGIMLVSLAMEKVGPDSKKIVKAYEEIKGYRGITGVFNLSPEDHQGVKVEDSYPFIVQVIGGKFKIVAGVGWK